MWHNSYLYQYQIQMHLEFILFISHPVPSNKLGSSSFHWSSGVMGKLLLFPPAFRAIRKTLMPKSARPNFLANSLRPRKKSQQQKESNSVIYNGCCRIKDSYVGSLGQLGQLSVNPIQTLLILQTYLHNLCWKDIPASPAISMYKAVLES